MCLIVAKPEGAKFPSNKNLRYWFKMHPDGMGITYNVPGNNPQIIKGAMDINSMFNLINQIRNTIKPLSLDDLNIVIHYRQATEGIVCPQNCHPFPISCNSQKLSSLKLQCDYAIAHNGIISHYNTINSYYNPFDKTTDTQKYIVDTLMEFKDYILNPKLHRMIAADTNSKFAILSSNGIHYIGTFIYDNGIFYSNAGYKKAKKFTLPFTSSKQSLLNEYIYYPNDVYDIPPFDSLTEDNFPKDYHKCEACDDWFPTDCLIDTAEGYLCKGCYEYFCGNPDVRDAFSYSKIYTDCNKYR